VASAMGLEIIVPDHAEVISAVGDALSLVRAERERTFNNPTPADVQALVSEVEGEAMLAGASASTLDVRVEQVVERGATRVTVTGAVGLSSGAMPGRQVAPRDEITSIASSRGFETVTSLGHYWFATANAAGHLAVFDLYGDLVVEARGEALSARDATPERVDEAVVRQTKRVGPVSIPPDGWIIGGTRFLQAPDTSGAAIMETALALGTGGTDVTIIVGRT